MSHFIKTITILLCSSFSIGYAYYNQGGYTALTMLGRHPNARLQAMGKAASAVDGYLYSGLVNPAAIGTISGVVANYAVDPNSYYLVDEEDWYSDYFGVGVGINRFTLGIDLYQKRVYTMSLSLASLVISTRLSDDLYIGASMRMPEWKMGSFTFNGSHYDLGILKIFQLNPHLNSTRQLNLALSLSNITNAYLTNDSTENAPQTITGGIQYKFSLDDFVITNVVVASDLNYILNKHPKSNANLSIHSGFELSVMRYLQIRGGYFIEEQENFGNAKKFYQDFTYGIGLSVPIGDYLPNQVPAVISVSYTKMKQPTYIKSFDDWDDFTNFEIEIRFWK